MRVLVTGANGFVGSHIAQDLIAAGHQVVCLVRRTGNLNWIKDYPVELAYGDVCHPEYLVEPVKKVDAIVHAAGVVRAIHIENYYKINRDGTKNIVEAVASHNPNLKKVIYISSQAALGPAHGLTAKNDTEPENPVSDYGKSKLAGERELLKLPKNIPYTILRPSSVYGPKDKDVFIFFNLVNIGIVPKPLTTRYIQLVYVKDICTAVLASLENNISDGKTYYLAENRNYTWEEVGKTIAQALGRSAMPLPLPDAAFKLVSFFAEIYSKMNGKAAVLNKQKIVEMMQSYWIGDSSSAVKDLKLDFTKLEIGAKMSDSWYRENRWY